jgi:hypothetical protein
MKKIIYKNTKLILISTIFIISLLIYQTINVNAEAYNVPENNLTLQQIKAQIYLFDKALNEFGATSPEQALDMWVNGFKNRNGVMQYSVLCDGLKKDWIKRMGDPTNSYWIIGGSSPWLGDYTVIKSKKLNSSYKVTVKLHWVASGNYNDYEEKTLTIVKVNNKWCIKEIK